MNPDIRELAFIFLFLLFIIAGIQWILVHFVHSIVALLVSAGIAYILSSLYVSLKHATPNGGNFIPPFSEYIAPMLWIFGVLMILLICIILAEQKLTGKTIINFSQKQALWYLGAGTIVLVTFWVGKEIYGTYYFYKNFARGKVLVSHPSYLPIQIRDITFENTEKGNVTGTNDKKSTQFKIPDTEHSITSKENYTIFDSETEQMAIPRGLNNISIYWISPIEGKSFYQNITIDYSQLKEQTAGNTGVQFEGFLFNQKMILPFQLILLPKGIIEMYIDDRLVSTFQKPETFPIHEDDIVRKRLSFKSLLGNELSDKEMLKKMDDIKSRIK